MSESASIKALRETSPCYSPIRWKEIGIFTQGGQVLLDAARDTKKAGLDDTEILIRRAGEPNSWYQERLKRATTISYLGPIVNQFGTAVFTDPPSVKITKGNGDPDFYSLFQGNVDRGGNSLKEFLRAQLLKALILQRSYALVDFPVSDPENQPTTVLDEDALGTNRAFLTPVDREQILDWDTNPLGQMTFARIHSKKTIKDRGSRGVDGIKEEWREVFPDRIELFSVTYPKDKAPAQTTVLASQTFESRLEGKFPLVELDVGKELWIGNQLLPAERDLFNMLNAQRWAAYMTAYGLMVAKKKDLGANSGMLSDGMVITIGTDEDLKWVENTGSAIEKLDLILKSSKEEIHRVVRQLAQAAELSPSSFQQSGEAKARDAEPTQVVCSALGGIVRNYLMKLLNLIAVGRGEKTDFEIDGLVEFKNDFMSRLEALTDVPSPTAKRELAKKLVAQALPDATPELLQQINKEIDAGGEDASRVPLPQ
jgi:hypothetical protein